jgi:DNA-binding winged helix-turn-helix (wHTH) protein/tetratricopeptide (TPR) repeat protein
MRVFPPFRLDEANQCLWQGETRVPLMPKPFAVLRYLVEHAGRLVTHDELLTAIWPDTFVQPEVLRRYVLEIRRALGDRAEQPRFIETRPKRGYQFIASVTTDGVSSLPDAAVHVPTRLVGRDSALADLTARLSHARRGQRQIVFVVGEPGIGKTSLVDAFEDAVASVPATCVARGQSMEGFGGKEPYYPVFEALGQLARGQARSLVVDALASHAPTWLMQFPSLVRPEQQAALQGATLGATRERMVREICEALEVMARATALVLILEDLHWVDHSTIDLISAISRRREPARLLIIGTIRPADLILSESPLKTLKQDLLLHRLGHELALEPLRESDIAVYLTGQFAGGSVPDQLPSLIHRQSDGNPLFMTALLDHLAQRGVLSGAQGQWQITVPIETVDPGVPETLRQMLELQMQHLTDVERRLLKCASVAGQRFTAWSVATMLGSDVAAIEEECKAFAERHQFLKSSGHPDLADVVSTSTFEFRHALYREVLYRALNPAERAMFHRRLGQALESLQEPAPTELAAELALHFEQSRDFERAIRYLGLASQNASRRYAHREAVDALEHARELLAKVVVGLRPRLEQSILRGIGNALYALGDMARSAETYRLMATRAAEAGLLASQLDVLRQTHPAEAIPFFERAVELEPELTSAYVTLSRIYSNLGDASRAKEYAKLAHDQQGHVGEHERLSIAYQYHYEVTGNQSRAIEILEQWKESFPSEFQPVNSLALIHNFLGRFALGVTEGHEAVKRHPRHGYPYSNLAHAYRGLGRFDDAQRIAEQAVALGVETLPTRRLLYQLAVLKGADETARIHFEWARDRPREFDMVGARAQVSGWSGKIHVARRFYADAARMAELRNLTDVGSSHLAWSTWMELAYGNTERAQHDARQVLARNPSYDPRLRAALTLAATGFAHEAEAIADELAVANPEHTLINSVLVPIVRAGIELSRHQPARAIAQLQAVEAYELGFIAAFAPIYLRGQALLMQESGAQAAGEFQRILDRRGTDPFSPFHAVASVGLARARAMAGDVGESLRAYDAFLAGWADADEDVPILLEARHERDCLS